MNAIVASVVRTCSGSNCGRRFVPPAACPQAKQCRSCHQAARKREQERQAALAALAAREAGEKEMASALKEGYLSGSLPKSAAVRASGRQRVVNWMGRSITFYVAA